jgi:hypothetical protein
MINISIDAPDVKTVFKNSSRSSKDLTINDIESVYELLSEHFFHNEIPESDEPDIEKDINSVELFYFHPDTYHFGYQDYTLHHQSNYKESFPVPFSKPNSPPPKRV